MTESRSSKQTSTHHRSCSRGHTEADLRAHEQNVA
eukprot:CAMPEP_0177773552 /NCGR_PEP_ID=MMETSP0491_2-20121128/12942_1 /TAXON_ID=63592 /ORGANISM="Tetraselmis chuii, Strain PLY429" /LENGTH=34 /DNA_ID= /DNA_START= /DNA_END= /DNA_ORIENTATION=